MPSRIEIRDATADDPGLILHFVKELAAYEKAPDAVMATEADIRRSISRHGWGDAACTWRTCMSRRLPGKPVREKRCCSTADEWVGYRLAGEALERLAGRA